MVITPDKRQEIAEELLDELNGRLDGSRKNIIANCPHCGREKKFGVYVGNNQNRKKFGMANCFVCGFRLGNLRATLEYLNRMDIYPGETTSLDDDVANDDLFEDEINDNLVAVEMPKGYKRCFRNTYLKSRGWIADDYEYFPVGTNRNIEWEYSDYVILEVRDEGRTVGFVARSVLSKEEIAEYDRSHRIPLRRYKNNNEALGNGFGKLLYNYDAIVPMETHSVILCEGCFDVVALTRKLELYDNKVIVPVATFGKKISLEQMFKLQKKGVEQVVIGYDNDAKETTSKVANELDQYFDVLIADIPNGIGKDWDEMLVEDIVEVFTNNLKTVREFNLD